MTIDDMINKTLKEYKDETKILLRTDFYNTTVLTLKFYNKSNNKTTYKTYVVDCCERRYMKGSSTHDLETAKHNHLAAEYHEKVDGLNDYQRMDIRNDDTYLD